MASAVDAARAHTGFSANTVTWNVTLPASSAGDLLFVKFRSSNGQLTNALTSGWTSLMTDNTADASNDTTSIWYRKADGTEGTSMSIVWQGIGARGDATTWKITGAADPATDPPQMSSVQVGTTANPDPASFSPTGGAKDWLWLLTYSWDGGADASLVTAPTGYSNKAGGVDGGSGSAAGKCSTGGCTKSTTGTTSENPGVIGAAAPNTGWTVVLIAIPPAVAGPQTISGGVAGEADAGVAGKVQQVYTASPAPEADSGTVGKVQQRYTAAPAPEADAAVAGLTLQRILVFGGVAGEADAGTSGTVLQPQLIAGGRANENDAAVAGQVRQTYTASPAPESDSAVGGKVLQTYTAAPAPEADSAPAAARKITALVAPEADAAVAGKVLQRYTAAPAPSAETAPAGQVRQTYTGTPAPSAETVPAGKVLQTYAASVAPETDTAPGGLRRQTYTASPAAEQDSVPAGFPDVPLLISGGVASEADSAPGGQRREVFASSPASEADVAVGGTILNRYSGGVGGEADSSPSGHAAQTYTAAPAPESDAAPAGARRITGLPAPEADSAPAASIVQGSSQVVQGGVARESDAAIAGTVSQPQAPVAGSPGGESDSAPAGRALQTYLAGVAQELDAALGGAPLLPVTIAGGTASESDGCLAGAVVLGHPVPGFLVLGVNGSRIAGRTGAAYLVLSERRETTSATRGGSLTLSAKRAPMETSERPK